MTTTQPVWITGVGTANPLGATFADTARALLAGQSGIGPIAFPAIKEYSTRIGAQLATIPSPPGYDATEFAQFPLPEQLFLWCADQALRDAGLWDRRSEMRVGVVLGCGAEWMVAWEQDWHKGRRWVLQPGSEPRPLLERIRARLQLAGPGTTVAAACASGNLALAVGRHWVQQGWADVCLAGGGDMAANPIPVGCFGTLGALSRRNDDPTGACRPFDRDRDGLVLGEGGALFLLERAEGARRRGARPYAEVAGIGASSDAFHMVIPNTDPAPAATAMHAALADARVNVEDVDYINAHATSTQVGDVCETRAIKTVFGEAASRIPVSATKSMTGHALSGAAAVDAVACLTALEHQALPPTLNLTDPDPECDLCHVALHTRPHRTRVVVSNSFGFGGSNTCLVLRKVA